MFPFNYSNSLALLLHFLLLPLLLHPLLPQPHQRIRPHPPILLQNPILQPKRRGLLPPGKAIREFFQWDSPAAVFAGEVVVLEGVGG
jgi:hypothetical protein